MKVCVMFAVLVLVSACTAPRTPNARRLDGEQTTYLVTDARQRIVASTSLGAFSRPGLADPGEIVCSEPSPDVASAVATTFSGALSVMGKGSGSLSTGQIETMAQLVERTASIQLLRDKMYQTCLAYANGAISGTTYSMIMAQLDRTIVSLLLGENAAAAFGRAGAAIGTQVGASGSASLTGPGANQDMQKSVKAVAEAQSALLKAQEGLAKVTKEKGEACGLEKASETGAGEACKAVATEESKVAEAENHLNATLRVLQTAAVVQSNARAETSKVTGVGELERSPTAELARELRLMQDNFLQQDPNDLFLPTCMVELGLHNQQGSTGGRILDLLLASIQTAKAGLSKAADAQRAAEFAATRDGTVPESSASEKDKAALNRARQEKADASSELTRTEGDLKSFLKDPNSLAEVLEAKGIGDPHQLLFNEVLELWRENKTPMHTPQGAEEISAVAAAANLNRRSQLAETCIEQLPAHLIYTRKFSEKYRIERLAAQVKIETAAAGSRDTVERGRLLEQFTNAMKACKEGDATQKKECELAVRKVLPGPGPEQD